MERDIEIRITFKFTDGESLEVKTLISENERRNTGSNIESSMRAGYVALEIEDKLRIIPMHNIQSLEISPSPHVVLAHCIPGVRIVE